MNIKEIELKSFVVDVIADLIEKPSEDIVTDADLAEYGVDSLIAATLSDELNTRLGYEINNLDEFIELSSIDDIVAFLIEKQTH